MSVPIRIVPWVVFVPLLASCHDYEGTEGILSYGAKEVGERETLRVHVDAAGVTDFTLEVEAVGDVAGEPMPSAWVTKFETELSTGFDVTPPCNAAPGKDTHYEVHVTTARGRGTLSLTVLDDRSPACIADVAMWLSSEDCTAVPTTPTLRLEDRSPTDRICVRVVPADLAGHPIGDVEIDVEPQADGFEVIEPVTATDGSIFYQRLIDDDDDDGQRWLVGEFDATYRVPIGTPGVLPLEQTMTIALGRPGDVGIEVGRVTEADAPVPFVPSEFGKATVPVTVHRFPGGNCSLTAHHPAPAPAPDVGCNASLPVSVRLSRGNRHVDVCGEMLCDLEEGDDHARFDLTYVPAIDSKEMMEIPLTATVTSAQEPVRVVVRLPVVSLAEDLACANRELSQLACVYQGGFARVVATTADGDTCVHHLVDGRQAAAPVSAGAAPVRILMAGRRILGIRGGLVEELAVSTATWAPLPLWPDFVQPDLPIEVVAIRSPGSTDPDWLVGLDRSIPTAAQLVFVRLIDGERRTRGGLGTAKKLGVIDVANVTSPGDELIVADGTTGTVDVGRNVHLYSIQWTGGFPGGVAALGRASTSNIPGGPRSIAVRDAPGPGDDDEVLIAFGDERTYAVPMFSIDPAGGLASSTSDAGGRSVVSAPDGSALIAGERGVTRYTAAGDFLERIDPMGAERDPFYGETVAPCVDVSGALVSFVVQTGLASMRWSEVGIVVETP